MKKLNEKQIHILHEHQGAGPRHFKQSSVLFYEGQIPLACYLLLEGSITLKKKKKIIMEIPPGHIVGLKEFQSGTPSAVTAWINGDSRAYIIDKSTFIELESHENEELNKIVS